jgi:hypothetical protein
LGELTFGANTYSAAQLTAADPRHIGLNSTLAAYYKSQLPQASVGDNGSTSAYVGTFDKSCGALSGSICDSVNVIGYKANILTPQSSNFLATRMDHDFGPKWHLMASYRYYSFTNLTSNQVDIGGVLAGDTLGVPKAVAPRPQQPWYFVVGAHDNHQFLPSQRFSLQLPAQLLAVEGGKRSTSGRRRARSHRTSRREFHHCSFLHIT